MTINGIAFHGSGGLLYYYLGIADYIQQNYELSDYQFCGVSGGCIPAFILSSGLLVRHMWKSCFIPWINETRRLNGSGLFLTTFSDESISILLKNLENSISDHKKVLENINKNLSIRMTEVDFLKINQCYLKKWDSLNDLLDSIIASCWVPGIFGSLSRSYKGKEYIDGGFPNSIEDRGDDWLKIKVNSFQNINEEIKVLLYASSLELLNSENLANKLYEQGFNDALNNDLYFSKLKKKDTPGYSGALH